MNRLITEYLEKTAVTFPDKIAFIDQNREITFSNLRKEALSIAGKLIEKGYYKQPVLLFMEKSISLISCFLGVAYSGNFYSPIDTKMPTARIEKIIATLKPAVVITDNKHKDQVVQFVSNCDVWLFEDMIEKQVVDVSSVFSITNRIIDTDILYVLFTSGSTGIPKGVIINHKAVIDFVDWISDCYGFDETTVLGNQAQLYFDLSIQDVYVPIKTGATTVLISNRMYTAPVRVWKTILKYQVNTLVWIPSMLSLFANLDILRNVEKGKLKTVLFCGEVMPMKQLNYWIKEYPDVVYGNLYGPTECTEACTYYTVDRGFSDDDVLPIGKPCENSDAMIIADDGRIIDSPGEIGELYIKGTCLSSGYYGDWDKTNEVFVQNPLNNQYPEMVYKTGDLVCLNEYHELVYVSRKDNQIKIRGYRVELGEIEAVVSSMPNINYNCCLFDSIDEKIILVYTGDVTEEELNSSLEKKLQHYMIPSQYIKRDEMLFNINGKVDRQALANMYLS
ncbi:MAG: amino acid adenylation domain-containing protein [Saccharofermentans sp.]|nr:amino acid adenylation domain-containing protein [Saccharofermentans sp.]